MINNRDRIGRFTSSNIYRLLGTNAVRDTYINEKRAERSLGRSIDLGAVSQSLTWGKIAEYYCNKFHLHISYKLCSDETNVHPKYKFWSGSQDAIKKDTAVEIKCFEPKNYYNYSMALLKLDAEKITLEDFKKDKEFGKVYWQVVSNAIILNKPYAEMIAYIPSEEQLVQIRNEVDKTNVLEVLGIEPWQGRFIYEKPFYGLPYIPEGIDYPNYVNYRFEVPVNDIILLTKAVLEAEKILTNGK